MLKSGAFLNLVLFTAVCHVALVTSQSGVCDPLVPQNCLLPFPNNFWTRQVCFFLSVSEKAFWQVYMVLVKDKVAEVGLFVHCRLSR